MTQPDAAVPDFTIKREPHRFVIDGEAFFAPAFLSPIALRKMAVQAGAVGDIGNMTDVESVIKAIDAVSSIMTTLMPGDSGRRFKARLESEGGEDDPPPIDLMNQAIPALYYLLECYGLRPTQPSSPSSDGSTDGQTNTPSDGTSSTVGPSLPELISENSTSQTG